VFDHLGVEQVRRWLQSWLGLRSTCPLTFWLHPVTKGLEDRVLVVRSLVTEEDVQRTIVDGFGLLEEQVSILLTDLAGDEGGYYLVHGIKA
jgi:hypothetical protein